MYFFEQYKTYKYRMAAEISATQQLPIILQYPRVAMYVLFIADRINMIVNTVYDLNNM
jgi:hypothetical protein